MIDIRKSLYYCVISKNGIMRKALFLIISFLATALLTQGCFFKWWEYDIELKVENHSNDTISVYFAMGYYTATPTIYPDTLLPKDEFVGWTKDSDSISSWLVVVPPHDVAQPYWWMWTKTDYWGHGAYSKFFDELNIDTLSIFMISTDSIRKYGYDFVAEHNIILARYDLSTSDMDRLNYRFPYPPTEDMRTMKVWIPKNENNK